MPVINVYAEVVGSTPWECDVFIVGAGRALWGACAVDPKWEFCHIVYQRLWRDDDSLPLAR